MNRAGRGALAVGVAAALAVSAAPASAAVVNSQFPDSLTVSDAGGVADQITVERIGLNEVRVTEPTGVTPQNSCTAQGATVVLCRLTPNLRTLVAVFVESGAGDDSITVEDATPAGLETSLHASGGDGNDVLISNGGASPDPIDMATLYGAQGNDALTIEGVLHDFPFGGSSLADGGPGNDRMTLIQVGTGELAGDAMRCLGESGDDTCVGGGLGDVFFGDDGNDKFFGGGGDDNCLNGSGSDVCFGQSGNDGCDGGKGDDVCNGGPGDDRLGGGASKTRQHDRCLGGPGFDTVHLGCAVTRGIERTVKRLHIFTSAP